MPHKVFTCWVLTGYSLSSSEGLFQYPCSQENKKEKVNSVPKDVKNSKLSYKMEGRRIKYWGWFMVSKPLPWARPLLHIPYIAVDLVHGIWFTCQGCFRRHCKWSQSVFSMDVSFFDTDFIEQVMPGGLSWVTIFTQRERFQGKWKDLCYLLPLFIFSHWKWEI